MDLPSFKDFIEACRKNRLFPRSAYVTHPEFSDLYVRVGPAWVMDTKVPSVVTIARVTSNQPGKGAFARLLSWIKAEYNLPVIVECVHQRRFQRYLERNGFSRMDNNTAPGNFYRE